MANSKENDLFLNKLGNQHMSVKDFEEVGFNAQNTSLESADTYKKNDKIRQQFTVNGVFDEQKFDNTYLTVQAEYNQLTQDTFLGELTSSRLFYKNDIFAPISKRNLNPETIVAKVPNPFKLRTGISYLNSVNDSPFSLMEIAELNRVLLNPEDVDFEKGDFSKAKWGDSPNAMSLLASIANNNFNWVKNLATTLVLSTWDHDGEHIDPITKEKKLHKKGEVRFDENGDLFFENLNGRDVYGKLVLSKWDTLTIDGTKLNTFDFFDSDDREKSLKGTLMREAVEIIPMFTPAAPIYLGLRVALQAGNLFTTIGRMIGDNAGWDTSVLANIEGFNKSLQTSTSEYAQSSPWAMENIINMAGDVVGQLAEQRWLFKYMPKLLMRDAPISAEQQAARAGEHAQAYINELAKTGELSGTTRTQLASMANWIGGNRTKEEIEAFLKVGERISKLYMTGITVADAYGEAKEAGASDAEAALLTLGYAAGEWSILSTDLGKWILPELKAEKMAMRDAVKTLMVGREKDAVKEAAGNVINPSWAHKLLNIGHKIAKADYAGVAGVKAIAANALGEGVEETSEELLYDAVKAIFNVKHQLSNDGVDYEPFKDWGLRYTQSFFGGVLGGAIGQINPEFRAQLKQYGNMSYDQAVLYMVYAIGEGKEEELKKAVNDLPVDNRFLSHNHYNIDKDGVLLREQGTDKDNLDRASKDMVIQTIDLFKSILDSHAASIPTKSLLHKHFNVIKDKRVLEMINTLVLSDGDATTKSGIVARYLQDFNTARTQLLAAQLQLNEFLDPKDVIDSEKKEYRERHKDDIAAALEALRAASEKVQKFTQGEYAPEFMRDLVMELTPEYINAFVNVNEIRFVEGMSGKSYEDAVSDGKGGVDEAKKQDWHTKWEAHKTGTYKDKLKNATTIARNLGMAWSPELMQIQQRYFENIDTNPIDQFIQNRDGIMEILTFTDEDRLELQVFDMALRLFNKGEYSDQMDLDVSPEIQLLKTLALNDPVLQEKLEQALSDLDEDTLTEEVDRQALIYSLATSNIPAQFLKSLVKEDGTVDVTSAKLLIQNQISYLIALSSGNNGQANEVFTKLYLYLQLLLTLNDAELVNTITSVASTASEEFDAPEYDPTNFLKAQRAEVTALVKDLLYDKINRDFDSIIKPIVNQGFAHPELKAAAINAINGTVNYLRNTGTMVPMLDGEGGVVTETDLETGEEIEKLVNSNSQRMQELLKYRDLIEEFQATPMLQIVDKFQLLVQQPTTRVSDLVKMADELLQDPQLDNIVISNNNQQAIDLALNVIEIMRTQLFGAGTDNVGEGSEFTNLFGVNATINALEKAYGVKEENRSNLAEIPSATANKMMQDLDPIRAKLLFLKKINAMNGSLKLAENHKVNGRYHSLMFNRFKTKLLGHLDDTWNEKKEGETQGALDKLKGVFDELSTLEALYQNPNMALTKETRKKLEELRLKMDDAIYEFFKANKGKDLTQLFRNLDYFDADEGLLHAGSAESDISDAHFAYWLMSRALMKSSTFLKDYMKAFALNPKIAPIAGQEAAAQLAYSVILNGDEASRWIKAISQAQGDNNAATEQSEINRRWKGLAGLGPVKEVPYDANNVARFLNTILIEGVAGSGKSTGVVSTVVSMLKASNHKELLSRAWLVHINDQKAQSLGENAGIKSNATYFGHQQLLKKIISTYKRDEADAHGIIQHNGAVKENDMAVLPYSIDELNDSEIPSILIIDEVGRLTTQEMDLIDKFAQKYGITVLALGDLDQTKALAIVPKELFNMPYTATLQRGNFAHSLKLGVAMRPDNVYKKINLEAIQANLHELIKVHLKLVKDGETVPLSALPKGISLLYFMDDSGVYGDRWITNTGSDNKSEIIKTIDTMVATATEPIIFQTYDPASTLVAELKAAVDESGKPKYDGKIIFKDANDTQGDEGLYYIVEANASSYTDAGNPEQFWGEIYTGISRAKQASLMIMPNSSVNVPWIHEIKLNYFQKLDLNESQITQAIKEREDTIKELQLGTEESEYVPRKNAHVTAYVETETAKNDQTTILEGENGPIVENNSEEVVKNEPLPEEPEVVTEEQKEKAKLFWYSFNSFETGWEWDDTRKLYKAGKDSKTRIDGLNGLYKIINSRVRQSAAIAAMAKLRNIAFYEPDIAKILELVRKLKVLDGSLEETPFADADNIVFAYKKTIDINNDERILNQHLGNAKGDKPVRAKLVMFIKKGDKFIQEIPLLTLPNIKTLLKSKAFAALKPMYTLAWKDADRYELDTKDGKHRAGEIVIPSLTKHFIDELAKVSDPTKPNYIPGALTMRGLATLYAEDSDELVFINREGALGKNWTPRAAFKSSGYLINTKSKGWDYDELGYETQALEEGKAKGEEWFVPINLFRSDVGLNISKVSITTSGSVTDGTTKIHFAKKGSPFVLITDLDIPQDNIATEYQKQLVEYARWLQEGGQRVDNIDFTTVDPSTIPDRFNRIRLIYVNAPEATFEEFILNEANKMTSAQAKNENNITILSIGLDFDIFRILNHEDVRKFLQNDSADAVTKAEYEAAYKIVDKLAEIQNQIDDIRGKNGLNKLSAEQLEIIRNKLLQMLDILASGDEALESLPGVSRDVKWANQHYLRKFLTDHFTYFDHTTKTRKLVDNYRSKAYYKAFEKALLNIGLDKIAYNSLAGLNAQNGQIVPVANQDWEYTVNGKLDSPVLHGESAALINYLAKYVETKLADDLLEFTGRTPAKKDVSKKTPAEEYIDSLKGIKDDVKKAMKEVLKDNPAELIESDIKDWCRINGRQYLKIGEFTFIGNPQGKNARLIPDTVSVTFEPETGNSGKITLNLQGVTLINTLGEPTGETLDCVFKADYDPSKSSIELIALETKIERTLPVNELVDSTNSLDNPNNVKDFVDWLRSSDVTEIAKSKSALRRNANIKALLDTRKYPSKDQVLAAVRTLLKESSTRSALAQYLLAQTDGRSSIMDDLLIALNGKKTEILIKSCNALTI